MNKKRRTQLESFVAPLENIKSQIQTLLDEEQEAYESMPESLQGSERGEKAENAVSSLESVIQSLEEARREY